MRVITLDQLADTYGLLGARIADPSPAMRVGGIMGLNEVQERFSTQKDPDGAPWPALRFARPEGGNIPLRNHGTLLASYTSEYGPDFWRVGTNLKKARLLHFGGTVVPVNKKWLTIPLTREAVYAGAAPNQPGLHFQRTQDPGSAGLYDNAGVKHWHLTKRVVVPPRKQVGASDALIDDWLDNVLVPYLTTGEL